MNKYQKLHYGEYRALLPDGTTTKISRSECFAPGPEPTEDNPYKQRWYYSPDRAVAIRLPRNEDGETVHRVNAADLRTEERAAERPRSCIAETSFAPCPISCGNCPHSDYCDSRFRDAGGKGCKRKCEACALRTVRGLELDRPLYTNNDGEEIMPDIQDADDAIIGFELRERQRECRLAVEALLDALGADDRQLCQLVKAGVSNVQIGKRLGISEGAVRKRIKKLRSVFEAAGLKNFI